MYSYRFSSDNVTVALTSNACNGSSARHLKGSGILFC